MADPTGQGAADQRGGLRALLAKQAAPAVLCCLVLWLASQQVGNVDPGAVFGAVGQIAPSGWAAAVLASGVSFAAVGGMEVAVHRLSGLATPPGLARMTGMAAVATAQLTGFGLLTGTLARWRLLPGSSLWQAAKLTAAVSFAFMAALGALAALAVLAAGPALPHARPLASAGLLAAACLVALTLWRPRALFALPLPPLRAQARFLGLALVDTLAAALALYVLLPAPVPPLAFYAAFLLALGAGLLGATPGGVGPFEFMLLACLPGLPAEQTLAAIVAYRAVYFALPAVLAGAALVIGPRLHWPRPPCPGRIGGAGDAPPAVLQALAFTAARAETGLIRQGDFGLLLDAGGRPLALVAPAGQSLIMPFDPLPPAARPEAAIAALAAAARDRDLSPCLYKCGGRTAAAARRAGWRVLRIADEAIVCPTRFDLSRPAFRQLRRHLRKAGAAGVTVSAAGPRPPFALMRAVAEECGAGLGRVRGFSMGRFGAAYVGGQRIHLAWHRGRLAGFLTLHEGWHERTLDLMCQRPDAPPGTMQALVAHAVAEAAAEGCDRLSLAAVPCPGAALPWPPPLARALDAAAGRAGLAQFKSAFAPRWAPLYLAAPGAPGLALAALDLADRITRPRD